MHIDQDAARILTDGEKQEYEVWQELLDSRGYKLLKEFLAESQVTTTSIIEHAGSWDQYLHARGQRDGLDLVLNLEALLESRIQSLVDIRTEERETASREYDELEVNLGMSQI